MIDWLATRPGRLAAFFLLYITEGLPLGYAGTFVATLMRQEGVSQQAIGGFVALFYIPWSFKWAAGPMVDLLPSRRWGARRPWILGTQLMMSASLSLLLLLHFAGRLSITDLALISTIVFLVNIFGAVQDVAIDALAVGTLHKSERGLANGLMFAGASAGAAIGGSAALFLYDSAGFAGSTFFVMAVLLLVAFGVSLWLREGCAQIAPGDQPAFGLQLSNYLATAKRAFLGSQMGRLGAIFALLPAGGYALGLALQTNLAVELDMTRDEIATLNVASTVVFAISCVAGGMASDLLGRLRSLTVYILLTTLPTLAFAWMMQQAGWIIPISPTAPDRPVPPEWLVDGFWAATLVFAAFNGLMYGTRSAFYMDFCDPHIAATQFTAYMAMMNLVISYTAFWQGFAVEALGYPITLTLDAAAGLLCLAVLAMVPRARRIDALAV